MKLKQTIMGSLFALTLLVSQSGCIGGIFLWPLWIPGVALGIAGTALVIDGAIYYRPGEWGSGTGLLIAGVLLDEKNPGHIDSLNPLPRDEQLASKIGVSVDDISDYNDNLNQIQKVAVELTGDIRSQVSKAKQITQIKQLISDPEINQLAQKYGFENAATFVQTFREEKLPSRYLENFAKNTQLPAVQAKILLYYGFGVQSQN